MTVFLKVQHNILIINTVSIAGLKQNIASVIKKVRYEGKPMIIMQRFEPVAVLLDHEYYEVLEKALEDKMDLGAIEDGKNESRKSSKVVAKKLGLRT